MQDLTFITNEPGKTLKDRFEVLIKDSRFFDILVGYFYITGFNTLARALEKTEKIRILIGISTNPETYKLIEESRSLFSHKETRDIASNLVKEELDDSKDDEETEESVRKFISWIQNGKLEIRAYPSRNIHAKLYIMTFKEGDRDTGRVITGSSNFTRAGLEDNLEFNVELKNRSDYEFAKKKFDELWAVSVDVSDKFVETIKTQTWLRDDITPYELYLKFLYEYFKDQLKESGEVFLPFEPKEFKRFDYQNQAVLNARKILEEYGGVFLSDVVGLGKTYMTAMLINQLDGRTMVIAPPALLNENNPGSWKNVFYDFHIPAKFFSIGKLDEALKEIEFRKDEYRNVVIDEAHRFRSEMTIGYEKLAQICRGKRVILVTATPYNNSPRDILNQIKLFQNTRKSTIPNLPNLERFFNKLNDKLKRIDRQKDYQRYIETVREISREIREKVLKYIMVRRTRSEIEKYFPQDIRKHGLKFPEIETPIPFYYQLNEEEDRIFDETVKMITQEFTYARYTPLLYLKRKISQSEEISQRNMGKFMKILLVKRLESSFYAFRRSIDRFIKSYESFLKAYKNGTVYVSKKHIYKIFEFLENDDDEAIQRLIDEGKAQKYDAKDFKPELEKNLEKDLSTLEKVKNMWSKIQRDPKLEKLLKELATNEILKNSKVIIFTESKETAEYLTEKIKNHLTEKVLCFTGDSGESVKIKVIENFDARARNPKDDYMILVSTEVLSEGVNLHRSNIVINYDIPWNPTRLMQRVGRVNRIDTKFDKIYTFNFFPTRQAENEIQLEKIAKAKINAFLTLLGGDAAILTEGEPVTSHELFDRLVSKKTILGEDSEESELKYLNIIREIRDKNPGLFEKIKRLPKKARSAKSNNEFNGHLLTYFRMGKIQKFFMVSDTSDPQELDFITAAKIFESSAEDKRTRLPDDYFKLLSKNKEAFKEVTTEELTEPSPRRGRDSATKLLKIIKITMKKSSILTDDQEDYLRTLSNRIEVGAIPKKTLNKTLKELSKLGNGIANPLKVLAILQKNISERFLESHYAETPIRFKGKREVILSLYLTGGQNE